MKTIYVVCWRCEKNVQIPDAEGFKKETKNYTCPHCKDIMSHILDKELPEIPTEFKVVKEEE
jgi:DNA-directed RNA polymerase subunit RPC12/RpoP